MRRRFRARRAGQLDRLRELFPNLGWLAVRDRIHSRQKIRRSARFGVDLPSFH